MSKKQTCEICGAIYRAIDVKRHCATAKHLKAVNSNAPLVTCDYENPERTIQEIFEDTINMDDPFKALANPVNYDDVQQSEPTNLKALSNVETKEPNIKTVEDEKEILVDKINKMIVLFDTEFGQEKQATLSDNVTTLKTRLRGMELTVNSNCVNNFISDAIISTILMIEPVTVNSSYDLRGLSAMLKTNKDFIRQCKLMSVKYGGFSNTPIELQLSFTIAMTAYIVVSKNRNSGSIKEILNEPYIPKITTKTTELPDTITIKL